MNFPKKLSCLIIAGSMILPYTAFAENNDYIELDAIYAPDSEDNGGGISMFSVGSSVTEDEKALMEYIADEYKKHTDEIEIADRFTISYNRFVDLYLNYIGNYIQEERPDVFISCISVTPKAYNDEERTMASIVPTYSMTAEELEAAQAEIDAERDKIIALTDDGMSDLQKILTVHDYIASNYEYDLNYQSRTLNTMVHQKSGVCQGYTYLFKYVMDALQIPCITVPSDACNHIWNKVMVDGEWYNIDVTQDDPVPNMAANISHAYFLVNDSAIKSFENDRNHITWNAVRWDGSPATVSDADDSHYAKLRTVGGATAYTDGSFFCFDKDNNLCKIVFDNEITLREDYVHSRRDSHTGNYIWYTNNGRSYYNSSYSTLALYNGKLYFNSPDKIYRYDLGDGSQQGSAAVVYEYQGRPNPDKSYFFGLSIKDGKLVAERPHEDIREGVREFVEIPIEEEKPPVKIELQEVATAEYNEQKNSVEVTVDIPEEIVAEYEDTMKVMVAQYTEDGVLIGFKEMDISTGNSDTINCVDDCHHIKTFVWSEDFTPLSLVTQFLIPSAAQSE